MSGKWAVLVILFMTIFVNEQNPIDAADPRPMTRTELKRLLRNASTPADYRKLAEYFYYREDWYQAKAQAEMKEFARCVCNIALRPKYPTGSDQAASLFEYYSAKASRQAQLAAKYDDLLIRSGMKPVGRKQTLSVVTAGEPGPVTGQASEVVPGLQSAYK